MSFLEKINKFNQYISFHIFAFAGWIALFVNIYLRIYYNKELEKYGTSGSWGDAFGWFFLCLNAIVLSIFIIAFIIFLFERVFYFEIKNKFLVENKFLKIIRYIGFILSLIYLSLLFAFLFIVPYLP